LSPQVYREKVNLEKCIDMSQSRHLVSSNNIDDIKNKNIDIIEGLMPEFEENDESTKMYIR